MEDVELCCLYDESRKFDYSDLEEARQYVRESDRLYYICDRAKSEELYAIREHKLNQHLNAYHDLSERVKNALDYLCQIGEIQ